LPCGHTLVCKCSDQDNLFCDVNIYVRFACKHNVQVFCGNTDDQLSKNCFISENYCKNCNKEFKDKPKKKDKEKKTIKKSQSFGNLNAP